MRTNQNANTFGLVALVAAVAAKEAYRLESFDPKPDSKPIWVFRTATLSCDVQEGNAIGTGLCHSNLFALRKTVVMEDPLLRYVIPSEYDGIAGVLICRLLPWRDDPRGASIDVPADLADAQVLCGQGFYPPHERGNEQRLVCATLGIHAATEYSFVGPFEGSDEHRFLVKRWNLGNPKSPHPAKEVLEEEARRPGQQQFAKTRELVEV